MKTTTSPGAHTARQVASFLGLDNQTTVYEIPETGLARCRVGPNRGRLRFMGADVTCCTKGLDPINHESVIGLAPAAATRALARAADPYGEARKNTHCMNEPIRELEEHLDHVGSALGHAREAWSRVQRLCKETEDPAKRELAAETALVLRAQLVQLTRQAERLHAEIERLETQFDTE